MVINYDLPVKYNHPPTEPDYEVRMHRIGRELDIFDKKVNFSEAICPFLYLLH